MVRKYRRGPKTPVASSVCALSSVNMAVSVYALEENGMLLAIMRLVIGINRSVASQTLRPETPLRCERVQGTYYPLEVFPSGWSRTKERNDF